MVEFKIGVVAIQGDVSEHVSAMQKALRGRGSVLTIRHPGLIKECDGLVLPGGESTAISRQLQRYGMEAEIKEAVSSGIPIFATCAGLVLVSKEIEGEAKVRPMGLVDVRIGRNAFGGQKESFEADLDVKGFNAPYKAVFIRAPSIKSAGNGVEVLARVEENIVAARQGKILCLAFHPELADDLRFHKIFLEMIDGD